MKRMRWHSPLFVFLLSSMTAFAASNGDLPITTIIVKPDKEKILVNEPLYITVITKNESKKEIEFSGDFSQRISYTISYEDEPFVYVNTPAEILDSPEVTKIAHGSEFAWPSKILFYYMDSENSMKFVFPKPGKYRIQATLRAPLDYLNIRYDIAAITVEQPDQSEEQAQRLITDPKIAKMIRKATRLEGSSLPIEQFVENYPKSTYSDYARYSLGVYYMLATFRSLEKKKDFDSSLIKALNYYTGISESNPALRIRALYDVCFLFRPPFRFLAKKTVNIEEILVELDKRSQLAKAIGYKDKIEKIREELRLLSEKELNNPN
jgi:hypothetical protein